MIDPEKATDYHRNTKQLEEFILFWVCAAGKNGRAAARSLDSLLKYIGGYDIGPFNAIKIWGYYEHPETLEGWPELLRDHGIGCYSHKAKTMFQLATSNLNLKTCAASDLESIYGIGPKTARCFILHSREGARVSGLDTHMLRHLRDLGYDAPKSTPTGKKYLTFEKIVLSLADEAKMSPAEFDLMIWNKYSIKTEQKNG
jgi:3-methyladenine DNA glycosylase/8-oxoguanine DNA glycosylase